MQTTYGKREDAGTIGQLAERVLGTFRDSELARPAGTIIGVEEELQGAILPDTPDILARIDLLVETGEALSVIDFKTARSRWSSGRAQNQAEQLVLYGELAKSLAPIKALRLEFHVLSKSKPPTATREPVFVDAQRITRTLSIVRHVWRAIESEHFFPAPSPVNCPSCPYRKPCRAWPQ